MKSTKIFSILLVSILFLSLGLAAWQTLSNVSYQLYDDFNDNNINSTLWFNTSTGGNVANEQTSRAYVAAGVAVGGNGNANLTTKEDYFNYLRWTVDVINGTDPTGGWIHSVRIDGTVITDLDDTGGGLASVDTYAVGTWELNKTNSTYSTLYLDGALSRQINTDLTGIVQFITTTNNNADHAYQVIDNVYLNKPSVDIVKVAPANKTSQITDYILINSTIEPYNSTTNNITFHIWDDSGTKFNESTRDISSTTKVIRTLNLTNIPIDTYVWNLEVCSTLDNTTFFCLMDDETNRTFSITGFIENNIFYNSTTYETENELITLNVTSNGTSITSTILSYNGTNYSGTVTSGTGNFYNLSREIQVPTGTGNKTFSYYFTLGGKTFQTSTYQHKTDATYFSGCNATYGTPALNITFQDEETSTVLNASVPASTFVYYLGDGTINKTSTYTETADKFNHTFCITPTDRQMRVSPRIQYEQQDTYSQRVWNPQVQLYNGTLDKEEVLYLASSANFITFQVLSSAQQPLANVISNVTDASGNLIEAGTTSSAGSITFLLDQDNLYTYGFSRSDYDTFIDTFQPTETSYTITMGGGASSATDDYTRGISWNITPTNFSLVNGTNYNFSYSLDSNFWNVDQFGFVLSNSTGTIFNTTKATTNGGLVSVILNTGNQSEIFMEYYYLIDGNYTNTTISWKVFDSENVGFSIRNFFIDLGNYMSQGMFGINHFGISMIAFTIILIFTGMASFKFGVQSPTVVSGFLFAITIFLDYGTNILAGASLPGAPALLPSAISIITGLIFIGSVFWEVNR